MRMWAVVGASVPLEYIEEATPAPVGSEVLIEVTHCGVCHSDLHMWKGEYNLGKGKTMKVTERTTLPRAPGHEIAGRVVAMGPDVQGVSIGDIRVVYPWIGCGKCARCAAGEDNLCSNQSSIGVISHGGFASHVIVPHARYLVDPLGVDPGLAATYACSGITAYSAVRKLGDVDPDQPVLVIGAGGLGHTAITILRALGHRNVIVADISDEKRQAAIDAGAKAVIDGGSEEFVAEIARAAGGPLLYAIDFVNATETAQAAFDSLAHGGRLVLAGAAGGTLEVPLAPMIFRPRAVLGTKTGTVQDLKDVIALADQGKLAPIPIEHLPFDEANAAMLRLRDGKVTGRVVLDHCGCH
jgi:alcohol dehydrogenase/propanol-preferring alcohol dehydrogenase